MPNLFSRARSRVSSPQGHRPSRRHDRRPLTSISASTAPRPAVRRTTQNRRVDAERRPAASSHQHAATVTEIVVAYTEFATGYYRKDGKPTDEVRMIKTAIKIVRELYGRTPAAEFGPLALKAVPRSDDRQGLVPQPNQQTSGPREADVQVGHRQQMIPGGVYEALRCVAGLKRGRTEAREGRKVMPISDADILATIEHLPAVVADMVQLQRLTGARPGEICDIRPGDINRKSIRGNTCRKRHKTEHHDRPRVIFIGAKGQQILLPYLLRAADAYCFSPREAEGKRRAAQHEARKMPLICGNRPGTNRKAKPRRTAGRKV